MCMPIVLYDVKISVLKQLNIYLIHMIIIIINNFLKPVINFCNFMLSGVISKISFNLENVIY